MLPEKFAPWGLVTVIGTVAILLIAGAPILAISNNTPYDSEYTPRGFSGTITPATPSGWQVNSTVVYHYNASEPAAVKKVYVPVYHPELKNYTMYYEVATIPPISPGPGGGEIPGWDRLWNNFTQLGPFQGHLTAYEDSAKVMLVYRGVTHMTFMNGGTFRAYYVGIGFVREFKNTDPASDAVLFMGDLNSSWLPVINNDVHYSGFTEFLSTTYSGALFVFPFFTVVSTSLLMAWVVYRTKLSDQRLDEFLRKASRLGEAQWHRLMALLVRPRMSGAGYELDVGSAVRLPRLDESIEELERAHLIEPRLVEKGEELVLTWKAAV